jgi:hypothetical protein
MSDVRDQVRDQGGLDDGAVTEDGEMAGYTGRHRQVVGEEEPGPAEEPGLGRG